VWCGIKEETMKKNRPAASKRTKPGTVKQKAIVFGKFRLDPDPNYVKILAQQGAGSHAKA
jgi:hypothetical protein